MQAARFMKWVATPIQGVAIIGSIILGAATSWYIGVLTFLVSCGAICLLGFSLARCPHCGQVWWPRRYLNMPRQAGENDSMPLEDETESFVCRRCRIDIGFAFRNEHETRS